MVSQKYAAHNIPPGALQRTSLGVWFLTLLLYLGHCILLLNRPLLELIPKEKVAGLPVFTQALRLVPFTMPEHWSGPRLCEDLPGLLHHLASAVILSAFVIHNLDPAYASLLSWRGCKQNLHLALQTAAGFKEVMIKQI